MEFKLLSKKNFWIFLATGFVIIFLAILAMSLRGKSSPKIELTNQQENEITKLQTQSNSDKVEDIEKDLNETDLNNLDKELQDIESELVTF